jgi:hypothetical protein
MFLIIIEIFALYFKYFMIVCQIPRSMINIIEDFNLDIS